MGGVPFLKHTPGDGPIPINAHACTYLQLYASDKSYASAVVPIQTEYSVFASHTCNDIQSVSFPPPELAPVWVAVTDHSLSLDFMSVVDAYLPTRLVRIVLPICSYKVV